MAYLINSTNCLTGWKDACNYILDNNDGFNLIVNISNPLDFTEGQIQELVDSQLIKQVDLNNVINTIFPYKLHKNNQDRPLRDFYDLHEKIYFRGKTMHSKNRTRWGNYFLRLTRFGSKKGNQLQNIIESINKRGKTYSACYIMHTSSIDVDNNTKPLGNPCLQYIQIGQVNDEINLTAVYRNHDFLTKALGNYIGLARLLEFICEKTNKRIGTFACHSIHYFLDNKTKVRRCLNGLTW